MQPGVTRRGATQPGVTQPGATRRGAMPLGPMQPGPMQPGRCSVRLFRDRRVAGFADHERRGERCPLSSACSTRLRCRRSHRPRFRRKAPQMPSPANPRLTGTLARANLPHGLSRVKLVVGMLKVAPGHSSHGSLPRRHSRAPRAERTGRGAAPGPVAFLSQTLQADRRHRYVRGVADAASARPCRGASRRLRPLRGPSARFRATLVSLHVLSVRRELVRVAPRRARQPAWLCASGLTIAGPASRRASS